MFASPTRVDPQSRRSDVVVKARLEFPADIAIAGKQLLVADTYPLRSVDTRTGEVADLLRTGTGLRPPAGVSVTGRFAVLTSAMLGSVQVVDLDTRAITATTSGFDHPADAIRLADERLLVTEPMSGKLIEVAGDARRVIAEGLNRPVGIADDGTGAILIAESGSGSLLSVDLVGGRRKVIATGLGTPPRGRPCQGRCLRPRRRRGAGVAS